MTRIPPPVSNPQMHAKIAWNALLVLAATFLAAANAQTRPVESVEILSTWGGLGPPRRSDIQIKRVDDHYTRNGGAIPGDRIQDLIDATQEPIIAAPDPANLGLTAQWLRDHVDEAGILATDIDFASGTPRQKNLFRSGFTDDRTLQARLASIYASFHTDDNPNLRIAIHFADGSTLSVNAHSQHPFMLPWVLTKGGTSMKTYNAHISAAILALLPTKFTNREALTGGAGNTDGLLAQLADHTGSEIRLRWEALGAELKAGTALASLRRSYEVRDSQVHSYFHLEYGKEWKGSEPQEENLHVDLWRPGFPVRFGVSAALLRHDGIVEGAETLPSNLRPYEDLVLSLRWLTGFLESHPNQYARLIYVHDRSLSDRAMRIFASDMNALGRRDLVVRVSEAHNRAALIETSNNEYAFEYGQGDYWIVLPDKTTILWRRQSPANVLQWKESSFPTYDCSEEPPGTGGCSGTVISPDGIVIDTPHLNTPKD